MVRVHDGRKTKGVLCRDQRGLTARKDGQFMEAMKKNLKIFGVGAVLPSLVIAFLTFDGPPALAISVVVMVLVGNVAIHCIREKAIDEYIGEAMDQLRIIEGLEYSLRSLRAKYGRLKSDIREMVK